MNGKEKFIGFGPDLRTPLDLLKKLDNDYRRILDNPLDTNAAFDFFVTAEHMGDWIDDRSLKHKVPELKIASHLATGAKHFNPHDSYQSVSHLDSPYEEETLQVSLIGDEARMFGTTISVCELAAKVLQYWRKHLSV